MDQARTLRHLLGRSQQAIHPILGDFQSGFVSRIARQVLAQHARQKQTALLFDAVPKTDEQARQHPDLIEFFSGRKSLEDLVRCASPQECRVPSSLGLNALMHHPHEAASLLSKLHRLPVTCDKLYATLPTKAWELASRFAPYSDWFWLVQPTTASVTCTFQAIRRASGVCSEAQHRIIVVGGKGSDEADHVYASLLDTSMPFLTRPLQYCGFIPKTQAEEALVRVAKAMCTSEPVAMA